MQTIKNRRFGVMQTSKWILKLYNGGVALNKISLALKMPISEIIDIIYSERIKMDTR